MDTIDAVPLAKGHLPLLGHGASLLRDPLGFVSSLPSMGKLVRVKMGPMTVIVVCDPQLTREVLLDDRTFDRGGPLYDRSREGAGEGLGTCTYATHRRQRRLCQPTFRLDRFPGYAKVMATAVEDVTRSWRDGQVIDLSSEMSKLTVRVAVRTMFSTSLPESTVQQVSDDFGVIAEGVFRRMVMPPLVNRLPTPGTRRYYQAKDRLRRIGAQLIAERRSDDRDRGDLLSSLLSARDPEAGADSASMTDIELSDQIFTFFLAGAETTASTLAWSLYMLGRAPDVEQAVHAEVDHVLTDRTAVFDDLGNLPTLNRMLTETLRMYPAGWLLTRVVARETELGGIRLPADTTVAVSPHIIHRREDIYERANEFVPSRWEDAKPDRTTYIPFGAGARKCIGDQFALTEAGLALATIAARWQLAALTDRPVSPSLKHLPAPRNLMMRLTSRITVEGAPGIAEQPVR
ncbi:cytochrome P450 [Rhodococcus sp. ABRD24]|nr:cytochrome P450 [Rhodococcus sp. ABRD24]